MKTESNKKRVSLGTLSVGDLCYPRSARPSGSFLRTSWRVTCFGDSGRVLLKLGKASRFVSVIDTVLIDIIEP